MQVIIFLLSIALLVILITKLRLHAFLSLLLVSLFMGLASGISPQEVTSTIANGFGGIMGYIGIVVVCGVIIGEVLEVTGGAQKIADSILKAVGKKRSAIATNLTGAVVSIPVFCDSGFVILNPIIKAISRVGKIPYMTLVIALMGGLLTTHAFVPPTPGPLAAAGILGADIGTVLMYGLIVTVPTSICVIIWATSPYIRRRFPEIATLDANDLAREEEFKGVVQNAPSTFLSYMPIVIPIALIVLQAFTKSFIDQETILASTLNFFGTPFIALLIGTGFSFLLPSVLNETVTEHWVSNALQKSANILLITAAGGAFGKVLQLVGVGELLGDFILDAGIPVILVPFMLASVSVIAQGSATVALLSTAAIVQPMLGILGLSPELTVIAIAAGSFTGVHSNGSYFWVVSKLAGFDLKKSYIAVTVTTLIMGASSFATVLAMSFFIS
jgi:GntP family gluconate:H+ symporter